MSASAAPKLAKGVWPPASKAPARRRRPRQRPSQPPKTAAAKAPATTSPAKRTTMASGAPKKARTTVKKGVTIRTRWVLPGAGAPATVLPEPLFWDALRRTRRLVVARSVRLRR